MPEVFDALDDLVQAGKLRHYGVSVEKVEEALKAIEYPGVQTVQIIFNMFRQRPAELLFREALRRQVGILARVPLSSGLLTGQDDARRRTFAADDHRAVQPRRRRRSTGARRSPGSTTRPGCRRSRSCARWCRRGRRCRSSRCGGS